MFILGLGHRARHGKDSVAREIIRECGCMGVYAKQYAFADALKSYCRVAFGMREKDAPLLQYIGTNVLRAKDPDIWVRVLLDTLYEQQPDVAIITDMRFSNEADAITDWGGYTMKVERRNADGTLWLTSDRDPHHPSEEALHDYEFDRVVSVHDGEHRLLLDDGLSAFHELYREYQQQRAA